MVPSRTVIGCLWLQSRLVVVAVPEPTSHQPRSYCSWKLLVGPPAPAVPIYSAEALVEVDVVPVDLFTVLTSSTNHGGPPCIVIPGIGGMGYVPTPSNLALAAAAVGHRGILFTGSQDIRHAQSQLDQSADGWPRWLKSFACTVTTTAGTVHQGPNQRSGTESQGPVDSIRCERELRPGWLCMRVKSPNHSLVLLQTNLPNFRTTLYRNMQRSYVEFQLFAEQIAYTNPQSESLRVFGGDLTTADLRRIDSHCAGSTATQHLGGDRRGG
jgi:hypothetical protein